jgi:hypothetical protein
MTVLELVQRKTIRLHGSVMDLRDLAAMSVGREVITPTEGHGLMRALDVFVKLIERYENEELAQLPQEKNLTR